MHTIIFRTIKCGLRTVHCPVAYPLYAGPHRSYCQSSEETPPAVRVRFAPSPTGYLHLGGLRTALYNYLFARANRGTFVLRIEDTDQSRLVPGATEQLCTDLEWAGLRPDEGPAAYGGSLGPYVQSERLDIYRTEVKQLLENGSAYYCFCSERRLELLRKDAVRARQVPRYDNRCRHLTPGQIAAKLAKQDTFCIRFKLDQFEHEYTDLVYGKMTYNVSEQEGDIVLIKSDGFPTYHFAHVVDDHHMKISHVLRGVEWQISTAKHLLLFNAFGWTPPQYGHLPLLVNADGTKLSKRQGNMNIEHYREKMGIRSKALINYITLSGGGFTRDPKTEIYSLPELQEMFDVHKINVNSARLNPDLLDNCNRMDIQRSLQDPQELRELVAQVKSMIRTAQPNSDNLHLDDKHIENILIWASNRIAKLDDLLSSDMMFLWVLPANAKSALKPETVNDLAATLENVNFSKENLKDALKEFAEKKHLKYSQLMKGLRSTLSGLEEGPGVAEMMEILGKKSTLQRIRKTT